MTVVSPVNYLAVLVAGLVYFFFGAIWYAKPVFGKAWGNLIGKTEEQMKADFSPWKLVWAFIASLLAAYGIARLLSLIPGVVAVSGLVIGLLVGIHFALAFISTNDAMEGRSIKLTAINVFYNIVGLMIMGLIIGGWR
jgi:hypothetical protein